MSDNDQFLPVFEWDNRFEYGDSCETLLRCSNDEVGCAILVGLMVDLFFPTQGVVGFEPTRLSPIGSQPTAFATQPHAQHKLNTKAYQTPPRDESGVTETTVNQQQGHHIARPGKVAG